MDAIKKYLNKNGIDLGDLSKAKFLKAKFLRDGFFTSFAEKDNIIESEYRDDNGFRSEGPKYRIKINGNNVILEEIISSKKTVEYATDFPVGDGAYDLYSMEKTIYYLDKNGEELLATETRSTKDSSEISEQDIDKLTPKYKVYERSKDDNTQYPIVDKIKEIEELQQRVLKLSEKGYNQERMISHLLDFAETVKKSRFGKFFFKKALNKVKDENEIEK